MYQNHFVIKSLILTEAGTFDDMIGRNYTSTINANTMGLLERTQGGRYLGPEALAGYSGQVIQQDITAAGTRALSIPNGWGTQRYRFTMIVGYDGTGLTTDVTYIYTGYTDGPGYSQMTNSFDPNMRFYFNNVIQVTKFMVSGFNGQLEQRVSVNEISHVLHQRTLGGGLNLDIAGQMQNLGQVNDHGVMIRPMDLFEYMHGRELQDTLGYEVLNMSTTPIVTNKSDRRNNVPSHYLSKALKSMNAGFRSPDYNVQSTEAIESARGHAAEQPFSSDHFLGMFSYEGLAAEGAITWGTLMNKYPYIDNITQLIKMGEAVYQGLDGDKYMSRRGENELLFNPVTMHYNGSPQALIATTIMQSIPAILLSNYIVRCVIVATNMTIGGGIHVEVRTPMSFIDLPQGYLIHHIPTVEENLRLNVFSDLPVNKEAPFTIELHVDIFGASFVNVQYNTPERVPFSIPSFCDGMFTPIVAPTRSPLEKISNDVKYLFEQLV